MNVTLSFIVFAALSTYLMVGAALVLVVVILGAAIFLFRSSGKKKGAKANATGTGADWQRQQGQQGQQPGAWNQPGTGATGDNAWAQQQQPGAWGAQTPSQQQQPGAWGAQTPSQQQPNPWEAQMPAQQQPGAWGAQMPAQQQPGAWGAQTPSQQQQQPNPWETQMPAQQQPGAWGAQSPAAQQPAASTWGAPSAPQPGAWGGANATPNTPSTTNGLGGNQSWDATALPQQQASATPDPWVQPQAQTSAPQQQGTPAWGLQNGTPAQQQQTPTAYGGSSASNQPWGQANQPVPAPVDSWGQGTPAQQNAWGQSQQPASPNASNNWGQPAQPQQGSGWGAPPFQQPAGNGNNPAAANWQQAPVQGQGFGGNNPGMGVVPGATFGSNENDKTMIRSGSPQGTLGIVRVEEGKEPGRVYEVRKDELSIGRSRESDIFLEDLAVSRLHAKIVSMGSGNYALKDEGSANGTKVNGQLVNKYQTYPLQEGDRIQLGQTVLVFAKR